MATKTLQIGLHNPKEGLTIRANKERKAPRLGVEAYWGCQRFTLCFFLVETLVDIHSYQLQRQPLDQKCQGVTCATSIEQFAVFTEEQTPARTRPTINNGKLR